MALQGPFDGPGPLMVGYLEKLSSGLVKHWNRRWFVLYGPGSGMVRIEYYDDLSKHNEKVGCRMIPLRDCRSCSQCTSLKTKPFIFRFTTPLGRHLFSAGDQGELDRWVSSIRAVIKLYIKREAKDNPGRPQNTVKSQPSSSSSLTAESRPEGVLLVSKVTAAPCNGSEKIGLRGSYWLHISKRGMMLKDTQHEEKVIVWDFRAIRTYGKTHATFNFETGSRSKHGHLRFIFECSKPREVFKVVNRCIEDAASEQRKKIGAERQAKQRPTKAHSMYQVTPDPEEEQVDSGEVEATLPTNESSTSSSSTANRSSVYLENPLQQLRAINSISGLPSKNEKYYSDYWNQNGASGFNDLIEESEDVTDNATPPPPSYQDVMVVKKTESDMLWDSILKQNSSKDPLSTMNVFGEDPFEDFVDNSHSFVSSSPLQLHDDPFASSTQPAPQSKPVTLDDPFSPPPKPLASSSPQWMQPISSMPQNNGETDDLFKELDQLLETHLQPLPLTDEHSALFDQFGQLQIPGSVSNTHSTNPFLD